MNIGFDCGGEMDWYDLYVDFIYGPFIRPVKDFWYWLQVTFWYKYHLIDTKLSHSWHDSDDLILHGMFSVLEDFVEIELAHMYSHIYNCPFRKENGIKYVEERQERKEYRTIKELYHWWKEERENDWDFENLNKKSEEGKTILADPYDVIEYEQKMYQKDNDMLIRLIKIRQYLWT